MQQMELLEAEPRAARGAARRRADRHRPASEWPAAPATAPAAASAWCSSTSTARWRTAGRCPTGARALELDRPDALAPRGNRLAATLRAGLKVSAPVIEPAAAAATPAGLRHTDTRTSDAPPADRRRGDPACPSPPLRRACRRRTACRSARSSPPSRRPSRCASSPRSSGTTTATGTSSSSIPATAGRQHPHRPGVRRALVAPAALIRAALAAARSCLRLRKAARSPRRGWRRARGQARSGQGRRGYRRRSGAATRRCRPISGRSGGRSAMHRARRGRRPWCRPSSLRAARRRSASTMAPAAVDYREEEHELGRPTLAEREEALERPEPVARSRRRPRASGRALEHTGVTVGGARRRPGAARPSALNEACTHWR